MTRKIALFGLLAISACGLAGSFFYRSLIQSRQAYERALADLRECQRIQQRIERLRSSEASDSHGRRKLTELVPYLQEAAVQSGLNPANIVYIEPGASQQVADGAPYIQQTVHIQLDCVPLPALGSFTKDIEANTKDFRVASLRLSDPRQADAKQEEWNCQMTLTCFVYSPIASVPAAE